MVISDLEMLPRKMGDQTLIGFMNSREFAQSLKRFEK